jgi:hypothetical protein
VLGQPLEIERARQLATDLLGYLQRLIPRPEQVLQPKADRRGYREIAVVQDALRELQQLNVRNLAVTLLDPLALTPGLLRNNRHTQLLESGS